MQVFQLGQGVYSDELQGVTQAEYYSFINTRTHYLLTIQRVNAEIYHVRDSRFAEIAFVTEAELLEILRKAPTPVMLPYPPQALVNPTEDEALAELLKGI